MQPVASKGCKEELTLVDVCLDLQPIYGTQDRLCRGQHSVAHDLQAQGAPWKHSCRSWAQCPKARSAPQVPAAGFLTMLVIRSTSPSSAPRAQDLVTSRRLDGLADLEGGAALLAGHG